MQEPSGTVFRTGFFRTMFQGSFDLSQPGEGYIHDTHSI